jgi:hypothetical protein
MKVFRMVPTAVPFCSASKVETHWRASSFLIIIIRNNSGQLFRNRLSCAGAETRSIKSNLSLLSNLSVISILSTLSTQGVLSTLSITLSMRSMLST